jgi:hypothetical protein
MVKVLQVLQLPQGRDPRRRIRQPIIPWLPPLLRCGSSILSPIHYIDVHFMHPSYYYRGGEGKPDNGQEKKNASNGHASTHSCGNRDVD